MSLCEPRWRRRAQERRPEILDAAFEVFGEHGFHGATLAQVARRAGVSAGTVSFYFGTKNQLFETMISERFTDLLEGEERAIVSHRGSYRELLQAVLRRFWERFSAPGTLDLVRRVEAEVDQFTPTFQQLFRQLGDRSRRMYIAILEAGVSRGEFRDLDVEATADVLAAMMWGVLRQANRSGHCGSEIAAERHWAVITEWTDRALRSD